MSAGMQLNQLYDWVGNNPLQRKILLAASHAEGHTLLERVVREHGAVLNTEVRTLVSWVLQLTELTLVQERIRYMGDDEAYWLVHRLLMQASGAGDRYLRGMTITPGVVRAFAEAVKELRAAGLKAADLSTAHFESEDKGECVRRLLDRYEQWLHHNRAADFAGLLPYASRLPKRQELIIVGQADGWPAVHRRMLETLAGENKLRTVDSPLDWLDSASRLDVGRVDCHHAAGPLSEVRGVFRRMVQHRIPWDRTELIVSDYEAYISAVYSVSQAYGVNCTFSGGLPIAYTNAGKAAEAYLSWLESNFNIRHMAMLLKQGVVRMKTDEDEGISQSALVRALEGSAIGWGRERYGLLHKLEAAAVNGGDAESAAVWGRLKAFFDSLFAGLPISMALTPAALMHEITRFVERNAVLRDAADRETASALKGLAESMNGFGEEGTPLPLPLAIAFARDAIGALRTAVASVQEPGAVHVTPLREGGLSGRSHTFILGMTERSWAISNRQHPILLDIERMRISSLLQTSDRRAALELEGRSGRLGMIGGSCCCSYSSYDMTDNTEHYPAFELLQLYRLKSGNGEADYETLRRYLGEPVRYFGESGGASAAIDGTDVWISQLIASSGQIKAGAEAVLQSHPGLADGARALAARRDGLALTAYDGIIDTDGEPITAYDEARPHVSASRLELFARCPLQYFYQEVLGIRPNRSPEFDRSSWLDALQRGSLLHAVYDRYLQAAAESGRLNGLAVPMHDRLLLERITEEAIAEYAELVPAPSASVFRKECESIRQDANVFYAVEQDRVSMPLWFELPLHTEQEPLPVELAGGLKLPVKGLVDRVDLVAPHAYKIYDYKTGNPKKYKEEGYFAGGTQIQLALYGAAVEQLLRESGKDAQATVVSSSYYFPTVKGLGEEAEREQSVSRREQLSSLVHSMLEAIGQGAFPPTGNPDLCKWCDYREACGDHALRFKGKRDREENSVRLRPILEVNGHA